MNEKTRRNFLTGSIGAVAGLGIMSPAIAYIALANTKPQDLIIKRTGSLTDLLTDIDDVANRVTEARDAIHLDDATPLPDVRSNLEIYSNNADDAYLLVLKTATPLYKDYLAQLKFQGFNNAFAFTPLKDKKPGLLPTTLEGYYIQVSSNHDDGIAISNVNGMKRIGSQNTTVLSGIVDDISYTRTLVGPYGTQADATKRAQELFKIDAFKNLLSEEEVGITNLNFSNGKSNLTWVDIQREVRSFDVSNSAMKDILLHEIARRKPRELKEGKRHFELAELETMLHEAVDKVNLTSEEKVDYDLAKSITYIETAFNPYAIATGIKEIVDKKTGETTSRVVTLGMGVMQVLKSTADKYVGRKHSTDEMFNPQINMFAGVTYIAHLLTLPKIKNALDQTEKQRLLFAAYNAGEGALEGSDNCPGQRIFECELNKGYAQTRNYTVKVAEAIRDVNRGKL